MEVRGNLVWEAQCYFQHLQCSVTVPILNAFFFCFLFCFFFFFCALNKYLDIKFVFCW